MYLSLVLVLPNNFLYYVQQFCLQDRRGACFVWQLIYIVNPSLPYKLETKTANNYKLELSLNMAGKV